MTTSFAPCLDVRVNHVVRSFWQMQSEQACHEETILPKGVVELIFSFQDAVPFQLENKALNGTTPRCFVSGMNDAPVQLKAPQRQLFFGVTLHPAALKKLLRVPSGRFLNTITDLEEVHKGFGELWHRLADADSFADRVVITQHWISQQQSQVHPQEMAISAFLHTAPEPVSVAALAGRFCYSPRQLNRKSQEMFGMSTEGLIRYKRYLHALRLMHQSTETLTRIGYDCHYYDQAHFSREFREFTGLTPGEYRQQKSTLPGHLFKNVR